jgi:hypothetical protein
LIEGRMALGTPVGLVQEIRTRCPIDNNCSNQEFTA